MKGWPNGEGLDWSADGKGLYLGSISPQSRTLLYVDRKGNVRVLWQFKGAGGNLWSLPSPDGRDLAILGSTFNSNVWMKLWERKRPRGGGPAGEGCRRRGVGSPTQGCEAVKKLAGADLKVCETTENAHLKVCASPVS